MTLMPGCNEKRRRELRRWVFGVSISSEKKCVKPEQEYTNKK
jgi:hypothetical protein